MKTALAYSEGLSGTALVGQTSLRRALDLQRISLRPVNRHDDLIVRLLGMSEAAVALPGKRLVAFGQFTDFRQFS